MPKITFENLNVTIDVSKGDTILDASIANDIPIQHACGGFCSCTTCHVIVKKGTENLAPMEDDENERIQGVERQSPTSRLACQSKVMGDVVVEIVNIDQ